MLVYNLHLGAEINLSRTNPDKKLNQSTSSAIKEFFCKSKK